MNQELKPRILIVEDNQEVADSLKVLLEMFGYETHLVYDGETAVQAAVALHPELIFMDIGLPRLNGYDATRQIREKSTGTSPLIVAVTGLDQDADRLRSAQAGMDHHLVKPVDVAVLKQFFQFVQAPWAHN